MSSICLNPAFADVARQLAAKAGATIGDAKWLAFSNKNGGYIVGPPISQNDGGEHGWYPWNQDHLLQTVEGQCLSLSFGCSWGVFYWPVPEKNPDGSPRYDARQVGGGLSGRPMGWSPEDAFDRVNGDRQLDGVVVTCQDENHFRLGRLLDLALNDAVPDYPVTVTFNLSAIGFPVFPITGTKAIAKFVLAFHGFCLAGETRQPYAAKNILGDRQAALWVDAAARMVSSGLILGADAQATADWASYALAFWENAPGGHFFQSGTLPGLWSMQLFQTCGYVGSIAGWTSKCLKDSPDLHARFDAIMRRRATWFVDGWAPGEQMHYLHGYKTIPTSGAPWDHLPKPDGVFDENYNAHYEVWCFPLMDMGAKAGIAGCAERRDYIFEKHKDEVGAKGYLVDADRKPLV